MTHESLQKISSSKATDHSQYRQHITRARALTTTLYVYYHCLIRRLLINANIDTGHNNTISFALMPYFASHRAFSTRIFSPPRPYVQPYANSRAAMLIMRTILFSRSLHASPLPQQIMTLTFALATWATRRSHRHD